MSERMPLGHALSDRKPMKPQRKNTPPPNPNKPAPKRFAQPKRPKRSGY